MNGRRNIFTMNNSRATTDGPRDALSDKILLAAEKKLQAYNKSTRNRNTGVGGLAYS